jgi:demethylmenaquinone methyltransferase/2-methoxy-6-polyprenyl-1,4-benzoquinol methylase
MGDHPPIGEVDGKAEDIEKMFDAIAPRYDLLNRILSAGIDRYWRTRAVRLLADEQPARVLDVATGTADLAIKAERTLHPREVVGVDLSAEMLAYGRDKLDRLGLSPRISLVQGDAADLPFADDHFDAALVAFGVRNFEDLEAGLRGIRRVLRPGAPLVVLEFSRPRAFPIKQLYAWYNEYILPRIGGALSPERSAYEYLPSSVAAFPDGPDFLRRMGESGFEDLLWDPLTFGIASLYRGVVPPDATAGAPAPADDTGIPHGHG